MWLCTCVCIHAHRGQKRPLGPLELELWAVGYWSWEPNPDPLENSKPFHLLPIHIPGCVTWSLSESHSALLELGQEVSCQRMCLWHTSCPKSFSAILLFMATVTKWVTSSIPCFHHHRTQSYFRPKPTQLERHKLKPLEQGAKGSLCSVPSCRLLAFCHGNRQLAKVLAIWTNWIQ